jgi:hypothetical protein
MGLEILYCAVCGGRILGHEFERGSAVWIGDEARCLLCATAGRGHAPGPARPHQAGQPSGPVRPRPSGVPRKTWSGFR